MITALPVSLDSSQILVTISSVFTSHNRKHINYKNNDIITLFK